MRNIRTFLSRTLVVSCLALRLFSFADDASASAKTETMSITMSEGIDLSDSAAVTRFKMNHPDVNVDVQSISTLHDDIAERLMSRDDTIDLYRMDANLGILPYMRDKGYFLDLSGNKDIREFTQAMAPVFQNQMSVNGQIMGVPSFIRNHPAIFERYDPSGHLHHPGIMSRKYKCDLLLPVQGLHYLKQG